jgi:hypothetical protein
VGVQCVVEGSNVVDMTILRLVDHECSCIMLWGVYYLSHWQR